MKKVLLLLAIFFFTQKIFAQTVTVAKDGSGTYTTIQAAINAAPTTATAAAPYIINIKNGKYYEKINIPSGKNFIQMIGQSVANVFVYYDDPATILGTQNSASFTVGANDFTALNITFANTYGDGSQAVAVLVNADRAAFKNCRFLGNQDTVYLKGTGTPRDYFKNCYIDGNVDFIFGSAVAVFDSCVVYAKSRTSTTSSFVTAPNTPTGQAYGFVFRNTALPNNTGGTSYYLSRPWPSPSEVATAQKAVYLNCLLSSHIQPTGWSTWDANTITANLYYAEYNSRYFNGGIVDVSQRVPWSYQLTQADSATYTFANMFGTWDPCSVTAGFCNGAGRDIAVANFRGTKGASTSTFNWNISWPMIGIQYDLYRSNDNVSFSIVNTQTSTSDTAVNFNYAEAIPPPGQTYYYYINASKSGLTTHITDTISISSTPTITTSGTLGSFLQGIGIPSNTQAYVVSGSSLTSDIVITAPANYEISSNGGTTWNNSSTPITLTQVGGSVANTTITVRLNGTVAGPYSGNITHTSTGAVTVNVPVTGTIQSTPLTVSVPLQLWPFTTDANDSANVRAAGVTASAPTFNKLYVSNGTTVPVVPAYSGLYGQAYGASSNGDGSWGTGIPGPGGNLNRTFYEQFTVTATSTYSLRIDSIVLTSSFYNTSSNTKLAVVYSKTGFTTADSTDVSGGTGLGLPLAGSANGAFATPILLTNETAGTTANYRLALNGATGVTVAAGQTLTFRVYNSCGSSSAGRYGKLKNVTVVGLATLNPVAGDYQTHQSGDWTDLTAWERFDGTNWVTPAPAYPVYNNSGITTILGGHAVTISATLANGSGYIHLTKIKQGGSLIVAAATALKVDGAGAPPGSADIQVDGTMTLSGSLSTNGNVSLVVNGTFVYAGTGLSINNAGDSVFVNTGGVYQHNANSNATPNAMKCQAGSTLSITGITTNQTGIFKTTSTYGNIVWNCPSQANYYAFRNTLNSTNVLGSFTVTSTGSTYVAFANASGRFNFPGGYYQTGGTVNFRESGTIADTLATASDFSVTGGTFLSNMSSGTSLAIELTGVNKTITYAGTNANNTNFNISGSYNLASNLTLPSAGFGVNVNGTLNMSTNVASGSGDFNLLANGSLISASLTGLNGNITNSGTKALSTSGNYTFNGVAAQTAGTLLPPTVNALTINNASDVTLNGSTAVIGGALTLTAGHLLLGSNNISATSVLGGSSAKYVVTDGTGALTINNVAAGSTVFPIGTSITAYNPVTLNNAGTADTIAVRVKNTLDNVVPDATKIVNKQWTITPKGTASNLTAAFSWLIGDQASSFDPASAINAIRFNGTSWEANTATISGSGVIATPYVATASGLTSFGNFAIANVSATQLPLNLVSFTATENNKQVNLQWSTTNEINTSNFVVERSADAVSFAPVTSVHANNTSGVNNYGAVDASPLQGVSYYRLKMIDKDGSFKYSNVVSVTINTLGVLSVYPNPASSTINVLHAKANSNAVLQIVSIDGRNIASYNVTANSVQTSIDVSKLVKGNYLLIFSNGGERTTTKFSKITN